MDTLFCCSSVVPYRPQRLLHEAKFTAFMKEATTSSVSTMASGAASSLSNDTYVVQMVRQVNYGAIEWKKYFAAAKEDNGSTSFHEVTEKDLIEANFKKLNAYKNFKCVSHNKFFELNLYEKDPVNRHHWRANIARPAGEIDLPAQAALDAPVGAGPSIPSGADGVVGEGDGSSVAPALEKMMADEDKGDRQTSFEHLLDDDGDVEERFGYRYGDRYSPDSPKDFTACSSDDCGNCGHCMY